MTSKSGEFNRILSFAIESINDEDRARLQQQLETLIQENPKFRVQVKAFEEGLIVSGEDELQLMEIRDNVLLTNQLTISELQIGYRETIRRSSEAEGKYIRKIGGSGNYGHVKIRIEPNEAGKGFDFINDIKGGVVPREYMKSIEEGIREALRGGVLAGYEIIDVKATLFDGSYHDFDSNEMAFRIAGSMAIKEAARKAIPVLLEPVMSVEVTAPGEFLGTILGDISARRGRIEGVEHAAGSQVVRAIVPLAEMLNSSARGRPGYLMHFAGYQAAPKRDGYFGDDAPAYARKPWNPKPLAGSAAAELED